jgi:uncharacterized Zn-binding protein involved in type VI secretion
MPAVAVQKISWTTPAPPAPPPGMVVVGIPTVTVAGNPIAYQGSPITPHGNPKIQPLCQTGPFISATFVPTVQVMGIPVAHVGALCDCGHKIAIGIPTVMIGSPSGGAGDTNATNATSESAGDTNATNATSESASGGEASASSSSTTPSTTPSTPPDGVTTQRFTQPGVSDSSLESGGTNADGSTWSVSSVTQNGVTTITTVGAQQ